MKKSLLMASFITAHLLMTTTIAAEKIAFHRQPLQQALSQMTATKQADPAQTTTPKRAFNETLDHHNITTLAAEEEEVEQQIKLKNYHYNKKTNKTIATYQQQYHGVPVLGGHLTVQYLGKPIKESQQKSLLLRENPNQSLISGRFVKGIDISEEEIALYNEKDQLQRSLDSAMAHYHSIYSDDSQKTQPASKRLVIAQIDDKPQLLHEVSFYLKTKDTPKRLITMLVDAENPEHVYKTFDAFKHYAYTPEYGPGGNTKTGLYRYGENGIPALQVRKKSRACLLQNDKLRVVNALDNIKRENYSRPVSFKCGESGQDQKCYCTTDPWWKDILSALDQIKPELQTQIDVDNWIDKNIEPNDVTSIKLVRAWLSGNYSLNDLLSSQEQVCYCAYSPANDAYYFGQTVYDVFKKWYDTNVLKEELLLRVHIVDIDDYKETGEQSFFNAFWDPESKSMNFGDGLLDQGYPLVSLDIAGHEIAHGFTEEHAELLYFDQTGSLNESFSDMAGIVTLEYLRQNTPSLYQKIYHTKDLNWSIGPTIQISPWDHLGNNSFDAQSYDYPIRYANQPSHDGASADCFNYVDGCNITYQQMKQNAYKLVEDEISYFCEADNIEMCRDLLVNNIVVHEGSGIFNKAFYLLANSEGWDVRKAFEVMLTANRDGYWINQDFFAQEGFLEDAACGTLAATKDLGYSVNDVRHAFQQVGLLLDNNTCNVV